MSKELEAKPVDTYVRREPDGSLVRIDCATGLPVGRSHSLSEIRDYVKYNETVVDLLVNLIANRGLTLWGACREPDMPHFNTVRRWMESKPDVRAKIEMAEKHRSEAFVQRALDEADSSGDPKLIVDTNKWAAGVSNSQKYGPKSKIEAEVKGAVSVSIDTGIRIPENYNRDECIRDVTPEGDLDGKPSKADDGAALSAADVSDTGNSTETNDE